MTTRISLAANSNKAGAKSGQARHVLIAKILINLTFFTLWAHDWLYRNTIRLGRTISAALANFFINHDGFNLVGDDASFALAPQFSCTVLYIDNCGNARD